MTERCGKFIYKKSEEFGHGDYGLVFLARNEEEKEEGQKKLYVIKIPLGDTMEINKKLAFNNELEILSILSQVPNNTYTSIMYDHQKFEDLEKVEEKKEVSKNEIKEENKEKKKIKPYYVMDYFSKGILLDYVASGRLTPRHKKYIFKKIIQAYKFLHQNNICHLDIKLENIMFDINFSPIIIDFGFSRKTRDKDGNLILIKTNEGSEPYATPEIWRDKGFYGEKADIFSLGAILFNLVALDRGFDSSSKSDPKYRLIMKKEYDNYWDKVNIPNPPDDFEDFKDLYQKMVAYKQEERPSFEEILNHPWFNEVNNLTQNQENEIKNELKGIHDIIKQGDEVFLSIKSKIKEEKLKTRGDETENEEIFKNKELEPKNIPKDRLILNQIIIINGNFCEVDFMNSLYREIKYKFENNSYFKASKENLNMKVIFEDEEDEEEKDKKEHFGECSMEIGLFKYETGKYLLEFRRTGGKYRDYYKYFLEIKKIITQKMNNKK